MSIKLNEHGLWEETANLYNKALMPPCNMKLTAESAKTRAENGNLVLRQAYAHVYIEQIRAAKEG